jgi:hypothetical protein
MGGRVSLDCLPEESINVLTLRRYGLAQHIAAQIATLPSLPISELRALWQDLYSRPAPALRRELLIPFLAYRVQENAFGGLTPSTANELRRIAQEEQTNRHKRKALMRLRPGTRLLRNWNGQTHEVFVTESGYEYRGTRFRSLSEIARTITNARWSGPVFFGLKKEKKGRA